MRIADLVPDMRNELERPRGEITELARKIVAVKEGSVRTYDSLEGRRTVGRHEAEIAGSRQDRLDTSSPSLSRGPAESSRFPAPIYFGDRRTLPNFLSQFVWSVRIGMS